MKIMIINGPNLNMLGIREKTIYGNETYDHLISLIENKASDLGIEVTCLQSNHEGQLIDWIQQAYFEGYDGTVINPGGYTHTSIAIADAIKAIDPIPVVEVHISDIDERDEFRKLSFCKPVCIEQIKGQGLNGYLLAMELLKKHAK